MCEAFYFANSSTFQLGDFISCKKSRVKIKTQLFYENNPLRGNTWEQRLFQYNDNIDDYINNNSYHSKDLEGAKQCLRTYAYAILIHTTVGLQIKNLRVREIKWFAPDQTTNKQ